MKILMLETMTYGDDISLEQFNRLGEVVTYSLSCLLYTSDAADEL